MNSTLLHSQAKALRFKQMKLKQGIAMLTAYDFPTAKIVDQAGVDAILVGDSLGMVVLGFPDTTHVTLDHMLHHVAAVARATPKALIIGDMPIHTYQNQDQALRTAQALHQAGADAVKLEGGEEHLESIHAIVEAGIPLIGHLGMLPQSVVQEGGYHKKGKTKQQEEQLLRDASLLAASGASGIILESVIAPLAEVITQNTHVPIIMIGCGTAKGDGEVAVISDVIGSYPWFVPPFARPEANVAQQIEQAVQRYIQRVRD